MHWARGADLEGNGTEPAERTDRMEWRTGRRGEATPGRDKPQHTRRGARGKGGGGRGEKREPRPGSSPRACRKRRVHTIRALHPTRQ